MTIGADLPSPEGPAQPTRVETMAAGALLHAFYNGIENLLKRIEVSTGGSLPAGDHWHSQLLDQSGDDTSSRPRVLAGSLIGRLDGYLRFRHAFRHLYAQQLEWRPMAVLLRDLPSVVDDVRAQIGDFLSRLDAWTAPPH